MDVLDAIDWSAVGGALVGRGWARLEAALGDDDCAALAAAAPSSWTLLPATEGVVHQGGESCGVLFADAAPAVQAFGEIVCRGLGEAVRVAPPVPEFNEVQFGRSRAGVGFISQHRDPPRAGGIIVIVTIRGRSRFRVWHAEAVTAWDTDAGDVVILRGAGWPTPDARCPLHEVESPTDGERMTMTLRHNTAGPGAGYFP